MKNLYIYLRESLDAKIAAWLKQVYETMVQLVKNNKFEPIDINVEQLGKPQESFIYDDYSKNQIIRKLISNNKFGFTVTNQMLQMPKKYLVEKTDKETKEIKPQLFPYWYRPSSLKNEAKTEEESTKETTDKIDPTYFIGLILYDLENIYLENYANIISIETSLCVKESEPVLKAMLNDWSLHSLNKEGNYQGLAAKPLHAKMKAILSKLGFVPFKDNKEILIYKL